MNAPRDAALVAEDAIVFTLNGEEVAAAPGETIIQVADRLGVSIPRLCYKAGYRPDGNCRACMVEIKGERVLAPSCCRQPAAGMEVRSDSARALHSQRMIVELLASDMPERMYKTASELDHWKRALGIGKPPAALEELVPRYLPAVPDDALAEAGHIHYLADAADPRVYSVGEDGVDDGGSDAVNPKGARRNQPRDLVVHLTSRPRTGDDAPSPENDLPPLSTTAPATAPTTTPE